MKDLFRKHHLLTILKKFEEIINNCPLDFFLNNYFRTHKSLGSKDRRFIADKIYLLFRWKGLIDYFIEKPLTWKKRVDLLSKVNILQLIEKKELPPHIKVSFPQKYFEKIKKDYGLEKTIQLCLASNTIAPTTIRTNTLKISTKKLFNLFKEKYEVSLCKEAKQGIIFHKKINFLATEEFKNGFFEIQDEGSQLIADLVNPHPNDQVLDFCAGSGGKTLAFASKIPKQGKIYLHDIRKNSLLQAQKRLKRAGIQNAKIIFPEELPNLKKKSMDWILLDVPCSGSGTLRRNPDLKWNFIIDDLNDFIQKQREIFKESLKYLKPNGYLVYATCSLFSEENEKQIDFFLKEFPFELIKTVSWLPEKDKKDGFFGAILKKIKI